MNSTHVFHSQLSQVSYVTWENNLSSLDLSTENIFLTSRLPHELIIILILITYLIYSFKQLSDASFVSDSSLYASDIIV